VRTRFSSHVHRGAHPASYTVGTGSFPGIKQSVRGVDQPPHSSSEVEGKAELFI